MQKQTTKRKLATAPLAALAAGIMLWAGTPGQASAAPSPGRYQSNPVDPVAPTAPLVQNLHLFPVMQAAGSVVGHPYRWGGSAPGGFDCSGLVIWSFGHVGKSLPRTSRAQRSATMPIARHEATAGDLVFFGSPVHHVGIYLGDGLMVHAPRAGKNVSFTSVDQMGSAPSFGRVK
ncbi:MAG: C40 family peptidase [Microthrixaceae bacterium]